MGSLFVHEFTIDAYRRLYVSIVLDDYLLSNVQAGELLAYFGYVIKPFRPIGMLSSYWGMLPECAYSGSDLIVCGELALRFSVSISAIYCHLVVPVSGYLLYRVSRLSDRFFKFYDEAWILYDPVKKRFCGSCSSDTDVVCFSSVELSNLLVSGKLRDIWGMV